MNEIEITEFVINNKEEIRKTFPEYQYNLFPDLNYYFQEQFLEEKQYRIIDCLISHFPEEFEIIQLTIDKNFVKLIFGE